MFPNFRVVFWFLIVKSEKWYHSIHKEHSTVKPPLSGLPKYGHVPQPGGKLRRFYIVRMRKTGRIFIIAHWTPRRTAAVFHDVRDECR